jgi:hypothetical protein
MVLAQPILARPTLIATSFRTFPQDLTISLPLGGCASTRRSLMLGVSDGEERKLKSESLRVVRKDTR